MEIERSREHLVNLTNYESIRVGATVRLTESDVADLGRKKISVDKAANEILDDLLREDLEEAWKQVPEGKSTHLDTWKGVVSGSDN